jgi:FkbM family methyltransferase
MTVVEPWLLRLERWRYHDLPWHVGRIAKWRRIISVGGVRVGVCSPAISQFAAGNLVLGHHEQKEQTAIARYLDPRLPILECGGGLGVIACLANRRLQRPNQHLVIEASPKLIPILARTKALNGCRFTIVHAAVAYGVPTVSFCEGDDLVTGRLAAGSVRIPTVTLRDELQRVGWPACTLICDIEGSEIDIFEHESELLRTVIQWVFLETHTLPDGRDSYDAIAPILAKHRFIRRWSKGAMHVFQRGQAMTMGSTYFPARRQSYWRS